MTGIEPSALAPKSVLRAISGLQHGEAVAIEAADGSLHIAIHAGADGAGAVSRLFSRSTGHPVLVLTSALARTLGLPVAPSTGRAVVLAGWADVTADPGAMLVRTAPAAPTSWRGDLTLQTAPPGSGEALAVDLAMLARLPPMLVVAEISPPPVPHVDECVPAGLLLVRAGELAACTDRAWPLHRVAEAQVPLLNAEVTRIVAFRPADGGSEHLAAIVGDLDPAEPVRTMVRWKHPARDLLQSLQGADDNGLRRAVRTLSASGGGVLITLSPGGHHGSQAEHLFATAQIGDLSDADIAQSIGAQSIGRARCWSSRHVLAILHQLGFARVRWMSVSD
ncbi:hypothetical protein JHL17_32325 [Azospirillum sp. YIM B02556]|uniref:GTP cyclohydrolase II domain-containing protein n=2 Tax=Azospirillum endophyticum TaxID=2800326 RepID=A0ABS1FF79_9PROT|nr:hypothetical protein [Azospirillum endophyticum]